ncbi:MAG: 30S ribosome-binding factor RbfA [Planctomycetes bacterium]|nr:30S ribosome-binding factor RbfA [Planctomycetota bacterium]
MSFKIERLQQVIKFKVAQVIMRDLADPRLGLTTVTKVKLAKDLSHCTIYYSVLGEDAEKSRTAHALADARGFVQREVAGCLRTRTTPHIDFKFDESIEGSARVSALIRDVLPEGATDEVEDDEAEGSDDGKSDEP